MDETLVEVTVMTGLVEVTDIPRMTPKPTWRVAILQRPWKPDREMWLATSSSGSPNDGRGADLAIFTGIWTHASS